MACNKETPVAFDISSVMQFEGRISRDEPPDSTISLVNHKYWLISNLLIGVIVIGNTINSM
jgi:hypothetical protein